jgi:hypothetical protein
MSANYSYFCSRRYAATAVLSLLCAFAVAAVTEPVRAKDEIPDIMLRPSAKSKQRDTAGSLSSGPKDKRIESKSKTVPVKRTTKQPVTRKASKHETVPNIVLQRSSPESSSSTVDNTAVVKHDRRSDPIEPAKREDEAVAPSSVVKQASAISDDPLSGKVQLASPIDSEAYTRISRQRTPVRANYESSQPQRGVSATVGPPSSSRNVGRITVTAVENHSLTVRPQNSSPRISQLPTVGQDNAGTPEATGAPQNGSPDRCAALAGRPFNEFGINVTMPAGELPTDFASTCWVSVNSAAGPLAGHRTFAQSIYAWDATCLCHRPLYFEETNLERYGYGCCETLQPLASAAHFFGTIPVLPYCMAVDCPNECIYTLGQYRPGSCVPKRYIWPPLSPRAILAEGGVWTGMVFLIP